MEAIPRRICVDRMTPAELAIREAVLAVEAAGADPRLTDAVVLLHQARERVADFVDGVIGARSSATGLTCSYCEQEVTPEIVKEMVGKCRHTFTVPIETREWTPSHKEWDVTRRVSRLRCSQPLCEAEIEVR